MFDGTPNVEHLRLLRTPAGFADSICVQAQHLEQLLQAHLMLSTLAKEAVGARQHALLSHRFALRLLEDSLRPSAQAAEQSPVAEGDCRPDGTQAQTPYPNMCALLAAVTAKIRVLQSPDAKHTLPQVQAAGSSRHGP